ncbi:MAG: hypothetical protein AAFW70_19240 [Cyanobacteria bacterium J06635_10]
MDIPVYLLTDITLNPDGGTAYSFSLLGLIVIGFIAAVGVGSIAWYNSKRPVGWEDKERPDIIPDIDKTETPGV